MISKVIFMQPETQINDVGDDELNRNNFAKKIAQSIIDYKFEESLTIGIMGSWGSGKSSLIKLTEDILKKEDLIIIHFNPWFFSNQENLYLQFFKSIITSLNNQKINDKSIFERKIIPKRKIFKKSDKSIENYFNYLKYSSIELDFDNLFYPLNAEDLESFDSLQFHKKQCEKYFSSLSLKIIVIIDDIDRLTDKEISQIFILVKSLADFKNFIYILLFDKLIVSRAINPINSKDNKFIDKIIQIPISVPKISEIKMDELILKYIKTIYNDQLEKNYKRVSNNFDEIFDYLKIFIKDFRDLKRYQNTLRFYLDNFLGELNIDDFFLILALHLFEHELFLKIKENKEYLVIRKSVFENNYSKITPRGFNSDFIKIIGEDNIKKYDQLLIFLFPALSPSSSLFSKENYLNWDKNHKICAENYFEKYFTLSLEDYEASDPYLNQLIQLSDERKIFNFFTQNKNVDYNHSLLVKFRKNIPNIPPINIELFIKSLIMAGDSMELNFTSRIYFKWILDDLFNEINSSEKCYEILKDSINYYDNNLFTVTEYINSLALYYDLNDKNNKTEKRIFIDENQTKKLIKLVVDKIHKNKENKDFLNQDYLQNMLNYWEFLEDYQTVKNYILENVNTSEETLSFLTKFLNEDSKKDFSFDFEKLNTYHGLKFYENNMNSILNQNNTNEKTKYFCELFLSQLNEYKSKNHPIFITYLAEFKTTYDTMENWINNSDINWKNLSRAVAYNPQNQRFNKDVEALLENHIKNSSLLIFISDMYNTNINKLCISAEIKIAQKYNKPILATKNWNYEDLPPQIQKAPGKYVNWQRDDVINGIKELLGID